MRHTDLQTWPELPGCWLQIEIFYGLEGSRLHPHPPQPARPPISRCMLLTAPQHNDAQLAWLSHASMMKGFIHLNNTDKSTIVLRM